MIGGGKYSVARPNKFLGWPNLPTPHERVSTRVRGLEEQIARLRSISRRRFQ